MPTRALALPLTAAIIAATAAACLGRGSSPRPNAARTVACRRISHSGSAVVPRVTGTAFDAAVRRLLGRLPVSVPPFIPFHDTMAR